MIDRLNKLKTELEAVLSELQGLKDRYQDLYDKRSERWQESENGEECQEKIDHLGDAIFPFDFFDMDEVIDAYKEYSKL